MVKPLIGISCGVDDSSHNIILRSYYGEAVEAFGGMYVLLPPQNSETACEILKHLNGLILAGGGDIHPLFWGEEALKGIGSVDTVRDKWEIALALAAIDRGIPILGICRGMQVINVALGGSLWQENPVASEHKQTAPYFQTWHLVNIIDAEFASFVKGESALVNSCHHQAIRRLGKDLKVAAKATDDIVEALIGKNRIMGVQWHPEYLWQDEGVSKELFKSFIRISIDEKQDYR